jgi:ATP-dependent RNA/DNA helicase IGHMBP2
MASLRLESLPPRLRRGDILRFVCEASGIAGGQVGRIDLRGSIAIVEVPGPWLARLVRALDGAALNENRVHARADGTFVGGDGDEHFARLVRLLELEATAETGRAGESGPAFDPSRSGKVLAGLVIASEDSGLGGRCILSLTRRNRDLELPWNRLEPGTPVVMIADADAERWRAVVCERDRMRISIALDEPPEGTDRFSNFSLRVSADQLGRQRQVAALDRVRSATRDRLAELREVLLGREEPRFGPVEPVPGLDSGLNASQRAAVDFALAAKDVAIVHGPPGTGKTTTLVEIVRQAVRRGEKVLVCAPSNLAVDNLLERLLVYGENAVRLGHPARVLESLRERTLDVLAMSHPDTRQARKFAKEAFALFRQAGKYTRAKPEPGARHAMRAEAKSLLADAGKLEAEAAESILNRANIVCATLTGLDSEILGQRSFDLAVIDEAGQGTEPATWLPILRAGRVVLGGDHCQLPPTILSTEASDAGLGVSLMERLASLYGDRATRLLTVQYRMHRHIMEFPSLHFYGAELTAHESVAEHRLRDLPGIAEGGVSETVVEFIDTAGAGFDEEPEPDSSSRRNPREAAIVVRKVRELLDAGVSPTSIGVIAPYSGQVRLLRETLDVAGLEIDSVDGFQGREKEAIVLSMVRSNAEGDIGFLGETRRMNVALTRARRKLIVVGDSATLGGDPFYAEMLAHFESIGAHRSVWDLL